MLNLFTTGLRRQGYMSRKRFAKGQTALNPEQEALNRFKEDFSVESQSGNILFNEEVACPFCAYVGRVIEFRTKKSERSKSYSTRMFKCPDCGQGMRRDTLLKDMTPSEWARWLYFDVIMYHGYDRISFPKLLERLKKYGWATEFWEAWKAAKEGRERSDAEAYIDYVRTSARESRSECPHFGKDTGKNSIRCTSCDLYGVCWPKDVKEV